MSAEPSRELTPQECASLIGGMLGTLTQMAPQEAILIALRWWLEHPSQIPPGPFDRPATPTDVPAPAARM
jgi:hypothetical protein